VTHSAGRPVPDVSHWVDLADRFMGSHRWIIATEALAALTAGLRRLRENGLPTPLVIAGSEGTGELPEPGTAEVIVLGTSGPDGEAPMMSGIRAFEAALRDLPDEVIERIRAWDPQGEARILTSFLDRETTIDGRPTVGARPEAWARLEDKLIADDLWAAAGVAHAPGRVVAATRAELPAAHADLDLGMGTVWACDTTEGWHGGAEYLRWVRGEADLEPALEFVGRRARRARVMPFLDGVPCSIHGMVFPEAVAVFRPIELLTLREPEGGRLWYGGTASTWDPPESDREEMRAAARRVGAHLADSAGFRGAFTVDGVMTADGFRPTELNPRFGGGLFNVAQGSGIPLVAIHRALIAGMEFDYRPADLERVAVAAADAGRVMRGMFAVDRPAVETEECPIRLDGGEVAEASAEDRNGSLVFGPAAHGGLVFVRIDPEHTPSGVQAAPIVAAALRLAARRWGLPIPELQAAPDVRRRPTGSPPNLTG
jgi:hypothetical protein